jgi:dihydrodipicolinate synthase/N-acetylneuraminate lyase
LLPACKGGLKIRGKDVGDPRKPILPLTNNEIVELKKLLKDLGY